MAVLLGCCLAVPLLCLLLDPGILRNGLLAVHLFFESQALLAHLRTLTHLLIAIPLVTLAAWLIWDRWHNLCTGVFTGALMVSLLASLLLLPVAMPGIIIGVGVLGLLPWLTVYGFWRASGLAAARAARAHRPRVTTAAFCLYLLLPCLCQLLVTSRVEDAWNRLARGTDGQAAAATESLHTLRWFFDSDLMVERWERVWSSKTADRRFREAYRRITGGDLEKRYRQINWD